MTNEDAIRWLDNLKNDIGNPHYERLWHYAQAIDEICYLLKEQEPKPLKMTENAYGVKFYFCPRCSRPIIKSSAIGKPRHCEDCGQAVMWE